MSILQLAEMFGEWTLVNERRGERFTSDEFYSDTEKLLGWKPKQNLIDWINLVKSN